jgi:hypothetical protein
MKALTAMFLSWLLRGLSLFAYRSYLRLHGWACDTEDRAGIGYEYLNGRGTDISGWYEAVPSDEYKVGGTD